jgi:hypothetical protein
MHIIPHLIKIMLRLQAQEVVKFLTSGFMNVASVIFVTRLTRRRKQTGPVESIYQRMLQNMMPLMR